MAENNELDILKIKTESKKTKRGKKRKRRKDKKQPGAGDGSARGGAGRVAFPKDAVAKCLRIPQGILDQNGGNECKDREAASYAKIGWTGPVGVEISSAIKYGLLERPSPGKIRPTDLARKIIRPQQPKDKLDGMRQAVLQAPVISDLYKRYRGENLPDREFLVNTAVDSFKVPKEKVEEFIEVFLQTLKDAELLEDVTGGKTRVLDATLPTEVGSGVGEEQIKKLSKGVTVQATDSCFVMMPFAEPLGGYYTTIYQPAIDKAKLKAVRADAEIFGTGKIIDQIWAGIHSARVLVAELTGRNPNVLYELGLAHALRKPVVLVSSNEDDVPFDVRHVRVIYYDMRDPFWGTKLIDKVAENILSALKNPAEAILFSEIK
ncbi:MAG TPA: hypothetical protein VGY31_02720 [Terriglobia bacterium]|nr:hypothetical protein [Terriglobia bacterium]